MAQHGVSISTSSIIRVFLVAIFFWLAYTVRATLLLVLISFILATIMGPIAKWGEVRKIPRGISVAIIYLLVFGIILGVGWTLAPLLVFEITQIAQNFGGYWDKAVAYLPLGLGENIKDVVQNNLNSIADAAKTGIAVTLSSVLSTVKGFVNVVGSFIIVVVLAFYFVSEERSLKKGLLRVLPVKHVPLVERLITNLQFWLGGWARGQIILSLIIGACVYIALTIIGVPYAFALALLAGLLEFIPYAGPIFSGIFGVFFALTVSPTIALVTALAYYVIQVLENNVIVPKVMQKAAGVNPVLSFIMILISFEALGVIGVFLGVPIASMIMAIAESVDPTESNV
jgi:predicted PurR-regulated permease PerM